MRKEPYESIASRAEDAWSKGRFDLAADIYMSIDQTDVLNDLLKGGDLAVDITYALRYAGRPKQAIEYVNKLLLSFDFKNSTQRYCQLRIAIADCLIDLKEPKKSLNYLLPIKDFNLHDIDMDLQASFFCTLSNAYYLSGNYEQCFSACNKLLNLIDIVGVDFGDKKDTALGIKALAERASGLLDLSLATYEARLLNARQSSDFTEFEIFMRRLDVIYISSLISGGLSNWTESDQDRFSDIIIHLQSKISSCIDKKVFLPPDYNNAFWICIDLLYMQENFFLVNDVLRGMYDYHTAMIGRNFGLAKITTFLGESYLHINNIEEAKRCGRESYSLALETLSPNAKAGEYTDGTLMFAGRIAKFLKNIKMNKESKKINKILKKRGRIPSEKSGGEE